MEGWGGAENPVGGGGRETTVNGNLHEKIIIQLILKEKHRGPRHLLPFNVKRSKVAYENKHQLTY